MCALASEQNISIKESDHEHGASIAQHSIVSIIVWHSHYLTPNIPLPQYRKTSIPPIPYANTLQYTSIRRQPPVSVRLLYFTI